MSKDESCFTFEAVGKLTKLKEVKYTNKEGQEKTGSSFILETTDGQKHEFRVFGYASNDAQKYGEGASVAISGDITARWNKITEGKYAGREFYKASFWNVKIQEVAVGVDVTKDSPPDGFGDGGF